MSFVSIDDNSTNGWITPNPPPNPAAAQAVDSAPQPPPANYGADVNEVPQHVDNGLDPTTGWAWGVVKDVTSPTGFSYNGRATYSDGAEYTPPATHGAVDVNEVPQYTPPPPPPVFGPSSDQLGVPLGDQILAQNQYPVSVPSYIDDPRLWWLRQAPSTNGESDYQPLVAPDTPWAPDRPMLIPGPNGEWMWSDNSEPWHQPSWYPDPYAPNPNDIPLPPAPEARAVTSGGIQYAGAQAQHGLVDVNEVPQPYGPSNDQLGVPNASWGYGYDNGQLPTTFNADTGQYTGPLSIPATEQDNIPQSFEGRQVSQPGWYDLYRQRVDALGDYMSHGQDAFNRAVAAANPPAAQPMQGGLADVNEVPQPPPPPNPVRIDSSGNITGYQNLGSDQINYPGQSPDEVNAILHRQYPSGPSWLDKLGNAWDAVANYRLPFQPDPNDASDPRNESFLGAAQSSVLGPDALNFIPNYKYLPLRDAANFVTSPMGLSTLVTGGALTSVPKAAEFGAGVLSGITAQEQAQEHLPEALNPYGITALGIGGLAGYGTGKLAEGAIERAPEFAGKVSERIPEPVSTALASEQGGGEFAGAHLPGSDLYAKAKLGALGGNIRSLPDEPPRTGDLLKTPSDLTAGEYTLNDVGKVAQDLRRNQVPNVTTSLAIEANPSFKTLGPTKIVTIGDTYPTRVEVFTDIKPTPAEAELGLKNAIATRVLERPNEYDLSRTQRDAVDKIAGIEERVKNEQVNRGADVNALQLEEGQNFIHRSATRASLAAQAEALVNAEKNPTANDLTQRGIGNSRLSVGNLKSRVFDDPLEAVKAGVEYASVKQAFRENVQQGLTRAANATVRDLVEPFGQTVKDRYPAGLQDAVTGLRDRLSALNGQLDTAERRAGVAQGAANELQRPLDKLGNGVTDRATARSVLKDARAELRQAQRDAVQESRRAGGAVAKDQTARAAFERAQARADAAMSRLQEAQKDALGLGEVQVTGMGVRLPALKGAAVERAVQEASLATDELRALARKTAMPVTAEAASNRTMLERGSAEIAARGAKGAMDEATARVVDAAKEVAPEDVYTAMRQMQRRVDALRSRGSKWSGLADSIQQEVDRVQSQYDEILPKWTEAKNRAQQSLTPGYANVDPKYAPALMGHSFPQADARTIASWYGAPKTRLGEILQSLDKVAAPLNQPVQAMHTVADFAAPGRLAPFALAMDYKAYFQSAGNTIHAMLNPDFLPDYFKRLDDQAVREGRPTTTDYAQHGMVFHNIEPDVQSFFNRVPGVTRAQSFLSTFGNFLRRTMADGTYDNLKSAGVDMGNPNALDEITSTLNKATGAGVRVPAGVRSVIAFPQWTGSQLAFIAKAAADGGIEGAYAREAILKTVGLWTAAAYAVNRSQGKPTSFANGIPVMYVGDQKLSLPGKMGQFVKGVLLAAEAAGNDAGLLHNGKGDYTYLLRANGSPLVQLGFDMYTGKSMGGVKAGWTEPEYWARFAAPFNVSDVDKDTLTKSGMMFHIANMLGFHNTPETPYELRDDQVREAGGKIVNGVLIPKDATWNDLTVQQRNALKAQSGSAASTYQTTNPDALAAQARKVSDRQTIVDQQSKVDQAFAGDGNRPSNPQAGQAWREQYHAVQLASQNLVEKDRRDFPYTGPSSPGTDPTYKALDAYYAEMRKDTTGAKLDSQAFDAWQSDPADAATMKLVNDYFNDPNKPESQPLTPMVDQYHKDAQALGNAGFFDVDKAAWQRAMKNNPAAAKYDNFADYEAAKQQEYEAKYGNRPNGTSIVKMALSRDPIAGIYTAVKKADMFKWVHEHPNEAKIASDWGYLLPTKAEQAIIDAQAMTP